MKNSRTFHSLLATALLLGACTMVSLEKKREEAPPPRTPEARALRINLALFKHKAEALRREALYVQLKEEGRLLFEQTSSE